MLPINLYGFLLSLIDISYPDSSKTDMSCLLDRGREKECAVMKTVVTEQKTEGIVHEMFVRSHPAWELFDVLSTL